MEFKGTKGEWSIGTAGAIVSNVIPNDYSTIDNDTIKYYGGFPIAESIQSSDDAKLIAAAPELLEAVKALKKRLEFIRSDKAKDYSDDDSTWLEIANKAINKAIEG